MLENFNVALTGKQRRRDAQPSEFLTHIRPLTQYSDCLRHRCDVLQIFGLRSSDRQYLMDVQYIMWSACIELQNNQHLPRYNRNRTFQNRQPLDMPKNQLCKWTWETYQLQRDRCIANLDKHSHHASQRIVRLTSLVATTDTCCKRLRVSLADRNSKIEVLSRSRHSPS